MCCACNMHHPTHPPTVDSLYSRSIKETRCRFVMLDSNRNLFRVPKVQVDCRLLCVACQHRAQWPLDTIIRCQSPNVVAFVSVTAGELGTGKLSVVSHVKTYNQSQKHWPFINKKEVDIRIKMDRMKRNFKRRIQRYWVF